MISPPTPGKNILRRTLKPKVFGQTSYWKLQEVFFNRAKKSLIIIMMGINLFIDKLVITSLIWCSQMGIVM